jgi:ABC-type multidrug transport system ATPase subunit/ABC-type polysaccharide/polyol phosphate export permease
VARSDDADLVLTDPFCRPECRFTLRRVPAGYELIPGQDVSLNGELISDKTLLSLGDRICVGATLLVLEDSPSVDNLTRLGTPGLPQVHGTLVPVPDAMKVILGREVSGQVCHLNHPLVSRRHAEISRVGRQACVRDLGSSNGTYVNNRRIETAVPLQPGDTVSLGPFRFRWTGDNLAPASSVVSTEERIPVRTELTCKHLTCRALDTKTPLVEDVSFTIQPGEFACILGPTGAGKSTLLRALANRQAASGPLGLSGEVLVNGEDLYQNFDRLKQQIAFVPQHEILFEELTLEASLRFTARLRLPSDINDDEIVQRVGEVLRSVQLNDCRNSRIGKLSGGQRRRASLANELLAGPGLLFLDEVTSGLDELTDSDMMSLFRRLAQEGRTLVCVTHSLACVPRDCTRVLCLTRFGRLAFDGTPQDAVKYFAVGQIGEIYRKLYVGTRAEAEGLAENFATFRRAVGGDAKEPEPARAGRAPQIQGAGRFPRQRKLSISEQVRQFQILLERYALKTALDARSNALRACQCAIVAALVLMVFGDVAHREFGEQEACAFILILSSYWFGCNNAAKEIVKERGIFEQERRVVVEVSCYAWSKLALLSVLSAAQAVVLVLTVRLAGNLPGEAVAWAGIASVLALAGVAAGLAISSLAASEEAAMALVPIILIPQIILSGTLAPLHGFNETLARVSIPLYWGLEYIRSLLVSGTPHPWKDYAVVAGQAWLAFTVAVYALHRGSASGSK